jgi:hypothetical protein
MAEFVDRFNCVALVERFNHIGRMQACHYAVIEPNISFLVLYISVVEGGMIILSLTMGESLGQVFLPPRFNNVFSADDM